MSVAPLDQAAELRLLMETRVTAKPASTPSPARPRRCRIIAVASGKGGVGKTNLAVNLSIVLSRLGRRVVLLDADLGTANVDVVLNVQTRYDLTDLIHGRRTVDEVAAHLADGLRLIRGVSGLPAFADMPASDRKRLIDQLGDLEGQSDFIVIDCGAGVSENVIAFAHAADELLIVTTPEPTAITDAYALVKVLARHDAPPAMNLVVNQAGSQSEARLVADRVSGVAERFLGIPLGSRGHILRDEHVSLAVRGRAAFVTRFPRCLAATCVTALAERLCRDLPARRNESGFFRRALAFFC